MTTIRRGVWLDGHFGDIKTVKGQPTFVYLPEENLELEQDKASMVMPILAAILGGIITVGLSIDGTISPLSIPVCGGATIVWAGLLWGRVILKRKAGCYAQKYSYLYRTLSEYERRDLIPAYEGNPIVPPRRMYPSEAAAREQEANESDAVKIERMRIEAEDRRRREDWASIHGIW